MHEKPTSYEHPLSCASQYNTERVKGWREVWEEASLLHAPSSMYSFQESFELATKLVYVIFTCFSNPVVEVNIT